MGEMLRTTAVFRCASTGGGLRALVASTAVRSASEERCARRERNGWIFVHLEGAPGQIGYQHGYLLAPEIQDAFKVVSTEAVTHDEQRTGSSSARRRAKSCGRASTEEYREELNGIAEGLQARGAKLGPGDVVALNALGRAGLTTTRWLRQAATPSRPAVRPRPSTAAPSWPPAATPKTAASSSRTTTGRATPRASAGTSSSTSSPPPGTASSWTAWPGLIHSGDDFGVNAAGILITETTISRFNGFDPNGIPEFVRARKAMQYAASIDDFARIMKEGNNGGYANDWLVADRKTNEIASLELGLKNVTLERTEDGYFVGANFPINPKLVRGRNGVRSQRQRAHSPNARRARWLAVDGASTRARSTWPRRSASWPTTYDTFDKKTGAQRAHARRPHRPLAARVCDPGSRHTASPAPCRTRRPTRRWPSACR